MAAETTTPDRPGMMHLADAFQYRLPPAGVVSILHRASGMLMFFLLPFVVWLFDASLTSEISYARFTSLFTAGVGLLPGWFFKLVVLGLIWAYLHHFIAGVRFVVIDVTHWARLDFGRKSAIFTLVVSLFLTLVLGIKLFLF